MKLFHRDQGQGRPLLILHGLFGQSDNWNTLARRFGERGLRAICIDLRNHGLSPHSEAWSYSDMASDVLELIDTERLTAPIVMGHSMGAKVAMFMEHLSPGRVPAYVLADMAARAYPPHHDKVITALKAVDFNKIKSRKEAEEVMLPLIPDFGTRQFLLKNIYWKDERMDWRFNLDVISRRYNEVIVPVPEFHSNADALIVYGANSDYVNEADIADFQQRFRQVKVVEIEGAGHWVHAEKPDDYFRAVMSFIEDEG